VDMAETLLLAGEPFPPPDPACTDPESDLEEPISFSQRPPSPAPPMAAR
jgi:hypothetical protein